MRLLSMFSSCPRIDPVTTAVVLSLGASGSLAVTNGGRSCRDPAGERMRDHFDPTFP